MVDASTMTDKRQKDNSIILKNIALASETHKKNQEQREFELKK
jgi:hypothetical protein